MPLMVEKLTNGTVIDHIEPFLGIQVLQILGLAANSQGKGASGSRLALVINVPSRKMGRKDILKIENRRLDEKEANKIALISPRASVSIIENGAVSRKSDVKLPLELIGIAKCPNPKCITADGLVHGHFITEPKGFRCKFCERIFHAKELAV